MQMLHAAGVPVVGSFPAFEDNIVLRLRDPNNLEVRREFYHSCRGMAIKLLDPHLCQPPIARDFRCIFLSRHPVEQAKSMLKLIGQRGNRQQRLAMERSVRSDTDAARKAMTRIGDGRYLNLPFENIIHDPLGAAQSIAGWVHTYRARPLDVEAMARCVRRRPATCLPYMLELEMIAHA